MEQIWRQDTKSDVISFESLREARKVRNDIVSVEKTLIHLSIDKSFQVRIEIM